ncbi:amidohydrolase [Campylobacter geochelonis]|uniref:Aminobenzoyl-glutamate utilization protein A n=1 Tax=Campylobacter geochelonis TaxID=1780362 RepID=A0A128EIF0_9BACT|nr:amidohydrolase [Campylobacter geochelonis]QKF70770.1 zinc-dependent amidase/aminoacylase/carboxypeptidase, peptidase M20 family [Campylobacter geochelonis]CZE48630.1 aminobenzoyl-glutamate utilization protein A [Campylobacter geochelonis]
MSDIGKIVANLQDEMIENRRLFHKTPETGWFTFYTTAKIAALLDSYGYTLKMGREIVDVNSRLGVGTSQKQQEAKERAKALLSDKEAKYLDVLEDGLTGVVATIDTKRHGKTTAFRFDIDCVDVTENASSSHRPAKDGFISTIPGQMHACGHDGHITIGLALAKALAENLSEFNGKFMFIFQTGEEGCRGAVAMEPTGFLKGVDYLLGAHIGFQAKVSGGVICGVNKFLATSKFDVNFTGKSAHAAGEPEAGRNALLAAAEAALAMHGITRNSQGVTRINVGVLRAGEGRNVIAPNGYIACETRGETTELNDFMRQKCFDIVEGVAKIHGVEYEITQTGGTAGGDSSPFVTELFYEAASESPFIQDDKIVKNFDFGACEDFAHFMRAVQKQGGQSGYMMIGSNLSAGHHNSCFDFDEKTLSAGLDIFLRASYKLNGN